MKEVTTGTNFGEMIILSLAVIGTLNVIEYAKKGVKYVIEKRKEERRKKKKEQK